MNPKLQEFFVDNEINDGESEDQWRKVTERRYGLMNVPEDLSVVDDAWEVHGNLWQSVHTLMAIDQLLGKLNYDDSLTDCFKCIEIWSDNHNGMYGLVHDQGWSLEDLRSWVCESINDYRFVLDSYIGNAKRLKEQESNKKQYLGWKTVAA